MRSDTSNWLWNVSSHITAILMSWPAESIVEKISLFVVDNLLNRIIHVTHVWGQACGTNNESNYDLPENPRCSHLHQISQKIMWSILRNLKPRPTNRKELERDPIVKLVVACCSSEFHITAIFDDLDRRFTSSSPFTP